MYLEFYFVQLLAIVLLISFSYLLACGYRGKDMLFNLGDCFIKWLLSDADVQLSVRSVLSAASAFQTDSLCTNQNIAGT